MPELPTLFLIDVDPQEADGVMLVDDEPTLVRELGQLTEPLDWTTIDDAPK